jgi:CheY-like chemotaxis protein
MARLKKVLHVDDDEDIRVIAKMAMDVVGDLEVHQCGSGAQAIAEAAAFAPDLFLLDFMMPEMDGETTFLHLRQIPGLENVPVIFMTARVERDFSAKLVEGGALKVLSKPFDPMELCAQLHEAWDGRANQ